MKDKERVENAVRTALCLRRSNMEDLSDTSLIYKISEELNVEFNLVNKIFSNCLLNDDLDDYIKDLL